MTIDFHAHPVLDAFRKWLPLWLDPRWKGIREQIYGGNGVKEA